MPLAVAAPHRYRGQEPGKHDIAGRRASPPLPCAAMPGQVFKEDNQIIRTYANGGSQSPWVPVLTVPAGQRISDRAVAAQTGRIFAATAAALPHARVADYATTHNPAFLTRDGRSTFALVYTPPVTGFGGPNLGPVLQHALDHAAPAGWKTGATGTELLANGN